MHQPAKMLVDQGVLPGKTLGLKMTYIWTDPQAGLSKAQIEIDHHARIFGSSYLRLSRGELQDFVVAMRDYKYQLMRVGEDPAFLEGVLQQSESLCIAAVTKNPWALAYCKNMTEKICMIALIGDPGVARLIPEKSMTAPIVDVIDARKKVEAAEREYNDAVNRSVLQIPGLAEILGLTEMIDD